MDFIFNGNVPKAVPKVLYVCARHYTSDCFLNEGQYKAGFANSLRIKNGSVPTVRDPTTNVGAAITSSSRDVACQTDPPDRRTASTQLSLRTLQPHFRSLGVQVSCKDFGVGTSTAAADHSSFVKRPSKRPRLDLEEEPELEDDPSEGSSSVAASKGQHPTYDPAESATAPSESTLLSQESSTPTHKSRKYIVYESCIMELFAACPVCTRACDVRTRRLGTFLSVEQRCPQCKFCRHWNSQPILGSTPAGNLHLSAAVYLSGASFSKISRVFKAMELQLFQYDTFCRHARSFIEPAVIHHWNTLQDVTLQRLSQESKVIVGGDMRADYPGHSAKFGSYTTMDLNSNTVLDIELVQSNEVGGSQHMEEEGLRRSLALLEERGISLDCIVTERHPQIQKFLSEMNFTHHYDVCHIAKGISKKMEKISKEKECQELQKWMRSITNHIYWTAATSSTGPERVAKWTSILNHVRDVHKHDDPLFPKCLHEIRQTRDKSKWLRAGTPAFYKLEKVLTNKRTLKDVEKLSPHHQTPFFEAFHRVIPRFAPKNVVFPFIGMLCRLYLAAMYYNENADRPQAKTREGVPLYKVHFPKALKGQCSAKPHQTEPTFRYVADMMDLIFDKVFVDPTPYTNAMLAIPVPEDLNAQYEHPDKEEVIASYVSRFNRGTV
ncbi:uncharacterized protein LOC115582760 isoform X2 [Sparus aurata]|uniref:uncharacterized protein LOC115582760 isoform X2 n=1 Tax=Sparus aurata TaxID=8175 RepID=UPI0011C0FEAD|nr:uncharacterized protein LOC115582760 isoform X2 [Sparus aurata]